MICIFFEDFILFGQVPQGVVNNDVFENVDIYFFQKICNFTNFVT